MTITRLFLGAWAAALLAFAWGPEAASAQGTNECFQMCNLQVKGCVDVGKVSRDQCLASCKALPGGPAKGSCFQGCGLGAAQQIISCRDDVAGCHETCGLALRDCTLDCVQVAEQCRTRVLTEGSDCRAGCQGTEEEVEACRDACGIDQGLNMEACGSEFETCNTACVPVDVEDEPEDENEEEEEEEEDDEPFGVSSSSETRGPPALPAAARGGR